MTGPTKVLVQVHGVSLSKASVCGHPWGMQVSSCHHRVTRAMKKIMVRLLNLIPCVAGKTFHFQAWWHWRVVAGVTGAPVMLVRLSGDTLQEELCWPDYSQKKPKSLSKFVNEDLPAHRQAVVERQVAAAGGCDLVENTPASAQHCCKTHASQESKSKLQEIK